MRDLINIVEGTLIEAKTIAHEAGDDDYFDSMMARMHRIKSQWPGGLKKVLSLAGVEVQTVSWPMGSDLRPYFFFVGPDGAPVGFCVLEKTPPQQDGGNVWFVKMVYLAPEWRRKNIGLSFYKFLIDHGIALMCGDRQTLASAAMWKKLGQMGYDIEDVGDERLVARKTT